MALDETDILNLLLRFLPTNFVYGIEEITPSGNRFVRDQDLVDFLEIYAPTFEDVLKDIEVFTDLPDVDGLASLIENRPTVGIEFMEALSYLIGYEYDRGKTVEEQVKTIKNLVEVYKRKSTIPSIERIIRLLGGRAEVFEPHPFMFRHSRSALSGTRIDPTQGVLEQDTGYFELDNPFVVLRFSGVTTRLSDTTAQNVVLPLLLHGFHEGYELETASEARDFVNSYSWNSSFVLPQNVSDASSFLASVSSEDYGILLQDLVTLEGFSTDKIFIRQSGSFSEEDEQRTIRMTTTEDMYRIADVALDFSAVLLPQSKYVDRYDKTELDSSEVDPPSSVSFELVAIEPRADHITSWGYWRHGVYEIRSTIQSSVYEPLVISSVHPAGVRLVHRYIQEADFGDGTQFTDYAVSDQSLTLIREHILHALRGQPAIKSGAGYALDDGYSGVGSLSGDQVLWTARNILREEQLEAFRRMWFSPLFSINNLKRKVFVPVGSSSIMSQSGTLSGDGQRSGGKLNHYIFEEYKEWGDRLDEQRGVEIFRIGTSGHTLSGCSGFSERSPISGPYVPQGASVLPLDSDCFVFTFSDEEIQGEYDTSIAAEDHTIIQTQDGLELIQPGPTVDETRLINEDGEIEARRYSWFSPLFEFDDPALTEPTTITDHPSNISSPDGVIFGHDHMDIQQGVEITSTSV